MSHMHLRHGPIGIAAAMLFGPIVYFGGIYKTIKTIKISNKSLKNIAKTPQKYNCLYIHFSFFLWLGIVAPIQAFANGTIVEIYMKVLLNYKNVKNCKNKLKFCCIRCFFVVFVKNLSIF